MSTSTIQLHRVRRATPERISFALAVVLTAATFACGTREQTQVAQLDADEVAQDREALDQLRSAGSDLTKPHEIEFYLYLPSEADARAAEAVLRPMGYSVTVRIGDNNVHWVCLASRTMSATIDELTAARRVFKGLARTHSGAYDGWVAAIQR